MNETFAKDLARVIWQYETVGWEQLDEDEIEMLINNYLSDNKIVLCRPPEDLISKPLKKS